MANSYRDMKLGIRVKPLIASREFPKHYDTRLRGDLVRLLDLRRTVVAHFGTRQNNDKADVQIKCQTNIM